MKDEDVCTQSPAKQRYVPAIDPCLLSLKGSFVIINANILISLTSIICHCGIKTLNCPHRASCVLSLWSLCRVSVSFLFLCFPVLALTVSCTSYASTTKGI